MKIEIVCKWLRYSARYKECLQKRGDLLEVETEVTGKK